MTFGEGLARSSKKRRWGTSPNGICPARLSCSRQWRRPAFCRLCLGLPDHPPMCHKRRQYASDISRVDSGPPSTVTVASVPSRRTIARPLSPPSVVFGLAARTVVVHQGTSSANFGYLMAFEMACDAPESQPRSVSFTGPHI